MHYDSTDDDADELSAETGPTLLTDGGSASEQESSSEQEGDEQESSDEQEGEQKSSDEQEDEQQASSDEQEGEEREQSDTDESEPEEPATIDADDEAVTEQSGDAGVEPARSQEAESGAESGGSGESLDTASSDGEGDTASIMEIRNRVRDLTTDVIGRSLDGIISVTRNDGVWRAIVEVIERRSVPDTQDILGQYEIELDENGEIIGYRRLEKYRRSDTGPSEY